MKNNKYDYLWIIQGRYPNYGWEDLSAYEKRIEARQDIRAYRENLPEGSYRLIQRRELRNRGV